MRRDYPQIVMYRPEIPQNLGTIGRLAAAVHCRLHVIRPTVFSLADRQLKRAGLDYWPFLDLEIHDSITPLLKDQGGRPAFFSKHGKKPYTAAGKRTYLVFGQETKGLPQELRDHYPEDIFSIPMFNSQVRSLNVANAVSIVVYHQLHLRGMF